MCHVPITPISKKKPSKKKKKHSVRMRPVGRNPYSKGRGAQLYEAILWMESGQFVSRPFPPGEGQPQMVVIVKSPKVPGT